MQKRYVWWAVLIVVIASLACEAQDFSPEIKEEQISSGEGVYTFDSQTILQSLAQSETSVFTLQLSTPESPRTGLPPVQWSQVDFYRIAQAFHEFAWQEPIESWKLNELFFKLDCEHAPLGPQFMSLDLFKSVHVRQTNSRLWRAIFIKPQQNQVSWIGIEYYPERSRWSSLDFAQIKIPAEQALQIAESQGGQEARLAAENKCWIDGALVAGLRDNDWRIAYTGEGLVRLFEINIDEQTGTYKIVYPKK